MMNGRNLCEFRGKISDEQIKLAKDLINKYKDIDFSNMTDKECRILINDIIRTGIDEKSLDDSKALLFRIDTDYWTDDEVIEKIKIFGRL